jgi:O-antigen biosynthesis protein
MTQRTTIVLPVYSGVRYVRLCLEELYRHTDINDFNLLVIDDYSDGYTQAFLEEYLADRENATVHRNPSNIGFLRSCNQAWTLDAAPFVVLLNSDVLVAPSWLPKLLRCVAADSSVAAVNPLTNNASEINLPLPAGTNHLGVDCALGRRAPECRDVVTGVGFCLLLRRSAVGAQLFDECYGMGYCEESDLCMRLTTSGWRTVVATNVYVHHRGSATFTNSVERYQTNRRLFDERWSADYARQYRQFRRAAPLARLRAQFSHPRRLWPLRHFRECYRSVLRAINARDADGAVRVLRRFLLHPRDMLYPQVSADLVQRLRRRESISVTYVFRGLGMTGGALSIIEIVNELTLLGIDARIATVSTYPGYRDWTWLLTEPMVFKSFSHMAAALPATDIVVATEWRSARTVHDIARNGRAKVAAYFLQDYEAWFIPERQQRQRQRVIDDYALISNRIVTSGWLAQKLLEHGYSSTEILLGLDLDQFYPRERQQHALTVLSMARPETPWRGFATAVQALAEVKRHLPNLRIVFFGSDRLDPADIPFDFENAGRVTNQNRLAQIYSDADVFLDASTFQGFGRCALEAMACGTAVVATDTGGVTEYARSEENCLTIPPNAPVETAAAVLRLLADGVLRRNLADAGAATARRFCHRREARETADFFRQLMHERQASPGELCDTPA